MTSQSMAVPSATAEIMQLSPTTIPSGLPPSTPQKRKITPSAETSHKKRAAVVTYPGMIKPFQRSIQRSTLPDPVGWPASAAYARIDARLPLLPNPLYQGGSTDPQQFSGYPLPNPLYQESAELRRSLQSAKHIILPFDLRVDPDAFYNPKNRELLSRIFPGNHGLSIDGGFLFFFQKEMPPTPWPKSIAGLPPYFTYEMGPQNTPRPFGVPVHWKNESIAEDLNGRNMIDWEPLFIVIRDHFQKLGVPITEVMYWKDYLLVILKHRNIDMSKLPQKAANIVVTYRYEDEMGRQSPPQARRQTDPMPGNPDESRYSSLQPGVRVSSAYIPSQPGMFVSSTAGVLVKDSVGNKFVTVASHGFPDECGSMVAHPLPSSGRQIGELIIEVSHTDISLVKLGNTETFLNETFQNEEVEEPIQLKRLVTVKDRQTWGFVFMDSPDTGFIAGNFTGTSFRAVDDGSPEMQWVFTAWVYMGQNSAGSLPSGICGSAIWTMEGEVLGFFRFAPINGFMRDYCAGVASDELIKRGFTLVDTN